jgi:hypothetical protein
MEREDLNDVLKRWHRRFQRSISIYDERFAEHGFDDLVVVVVAATYMEALLWLGVFFSGLDQSQQKSQMTLGQLVNVAAKRGAISADLQSLLKAFVRIRNGFAHNPEYRLEAQPVEDIRLGLPANNRRALDRAFANIIPGPSEALKARLVIEQLVRLTFEALADSHRRWSEARQSNE